MVPGYLDILFPPLARICLRWEMFVLQHLCGGQRITYRSGFSAATIRVLEMELR